MKYSPAPPYTVLQTRDISFEDLQRVGRFARYWDIFGNQGRFKHTLPLVMGSADAEFSHHFERFLAFSDALFAHEKSTWKISLKRQFVLLYEMVPALFDLTQDEVFAVLQLDFDRTNLKGDLATTVTPQINSKSNQANARQKRHLSS
jgi:hypothetical protein